MAAAIFSRNNDVLNIMALYDALCFYILMLYKQPSRVTRGIGDLRRRRRIGGLAKLWRKGVCDVTPGMCTEENMSA